MHHPDIEIGRDRISHSQKRNVKIVIRTLSCDQHGKPQGTKNLFLASEPLDGWRTVTVKDRRTMKDWVMFMKQLVDEHYPDADCIRVVPDNLSTHKPEAFYEYFEPAEARHLLDTLEFYFTPVHGSWLDMAEIEFNHLQQQPADI